VPGVRFIRRLKPGGSGGGLAAQGWRRSSHSGSLLQIPVSLALSLALLLRLHLRLDRMMVDDDDTDHDDDAEGVLMMLTVVTLHTQLPEDKSPRLLISGEDGEVLVVVERRRSSVNHSASQYHRGSSSRQNSPRPVRDSPRTSLAANPRDDVVNVPGYGPVALGVPALASTGGEGQGQGGKRGSQSGSGGSSTLALTGGAPPF
jgi:hypothetical protein